MESFETTALLPYEKDKIRKNLIDELAKEVKKEQGERVSIKSFKYGNVNKDNTVNIDVILSNDTFYRVKYDRAKGTIVDAEYNNHPYYV